MFKIRTTLENAKHAFLCLKSCDFLTLNYISQLFQVPPLFPPPPLSKPAARCSLINLNTMLGNVLHLLPSNLQTLFQYRLLWWCRLWNSRTLCKFFSIVLTCLVRFKEFSFLPPLSSINLFTCSFYKHLWSARNCVRPWVQKWVEPNISYDREET